MKLAELSNVKSLGFDIPNRTLTVVHSDSYDQIFERLDSLKLNTSLIDSVAAADYSAASDKPSSERKLLWQVLAINIFFFALELTTGLIAGSMGLVADSLDMLADSIVYLLALLAVGGTITRMKNIARAAGYLQLTLAVLGFIEVIRRFVGPEAVPSFQLMMIVSTLALMGNGYCLYILQKGKSKAPHMQASMIFTSNDVIVNVGVIVAAALVYMTSSSYPDLAIGAVVFAIVSRGAFKILRLSK